MNNYAVNIADMTDDKFQAGPINLAGMMVQYVTKTREVVDCEKGRGDGSGVILECDDERARAIIWTLNRKCLVRGYKKGPRGGWKRLSNKEVEEIKDE